MDIFSSAKLNLLMPKEINAHDSFFALDYPDTCRMDDLARSIRKEGLLAPLWCQQRHEGGYRVVDGFRRLEAARLSGLSALPALVFPPEINRLDLMRARLTGREGGISAVQAARLLKKIDSLIDGNAVVPDWFFGLVGPGAGKVQLDRLRSLDNLEEPLARWCSLNRTSLAEAAAIAAFRRDEQLDFLVLLESVNPSGNLLKRYLTLITETAAREKATPGKILADPAIRAILADPHTARSAGREVVSRRLHELRYPEMTALQERFDAAVKKLGLPENVRIEPPDMFEGDRVQVSFESGSPEELSKIGYAFQRAAESQSAQELFCCLGAPSREPGTGENS